MAIFNSYVSLPSVIPSHLGWLRTDFPALGFWYFPNDITVSCLSPVKNLKQPRHSRLQNLTTTSHISQYISQFYPSLSCSFIVISHYISLNQILHHHVIFVIFFGTPNQLMVNTWVIKCPHFSHHPTMNGIWSTRWLLFWVMSNISQNGTVTNP